MTLTKPALTELSSADILQAALFDKIAITDAQAELIRRQDARACFEFARDVLDADIAALQTCVAAHGSNELCLHFARDIVGADNRILQQRILATGSSDDCYQFAEDIFNADLDLLRARIVELGDTTILEKFDSNFPAGEVIWPPAL